MGKELILTQLLEHQADLVCTELSKSSMWMNVQKKLAQKKMLEKKSSSAWRGLDKASWTHFPDQSLVLLLLEDKLSTSMLYNKNFWRGQNPF